MGKRLNRRQFLLASAMVGGTGLLAACAQPAAPAATQAPAAPKATEAPKPAATTAPAAPVATAAPAATQAPAAVKKGGKLRYAADGDVLHLAPWVAINQSAIFYTVYETLVKRDLKGNFTPNLAKSWQLSDGGKAVTFDLQQGVKFHSGNEFTAETIEPAFKYLLKEGSSYHQWMADITKFEVLSKYQVKLTLKQPMSPLLLFLDMAQIADPAFDVKTLKSKGIGTGPFKVDAWAQGDTLRLVRNPDYWRKDVPLLDEINIKVWPDRSAMLVALESGNTDIAFNPPYQELPRLSKNTNVTVTTIPAMCEDILMNVTKKPYDNKKVRQGIAWAVNRQQFIDAYLFGFGEIWTSPLPKGSIGYAPDLEGRIGYDLNKAKQLIAEGGFPNGFDSTVMIGPDSRAPGMPVMAEILQADLKKIGVNLKIEAVEAQVCSDRWNAGQFDMSIHSYGRLKEPGELMQAMVWGKSNPEQYRGAEYQKLIDDGMATVDDKTKQDTYHRLFEIMLDECFCVPVAAVPRPLAYRKNVQNFSWSADGYLRADEITLA
jgi:peptide/nickel transport system substrate-binding protein